MRSTWINIASPFDPAGVEATGQFVTPDFIRGYSNSCPSGTTPESQFYLEAGRAPAEVLCY